MQVADRAILHQSAHLLMRGQVSVDFFVHPVSAAPKPRSLPAQLLSERLLHDEPVEITMEQELYQRDISSRVDSSPVALQRQL